MFLLKFIVFEWANKILVSSAKIGFSYANHMYTECNSFEIQDQL
jgi:hypothetical protein